MLPETGTHHVNSCRNVKEGAARLIVSENSDMESFYALIRKRTFQNERLLIRHCGRRLTAELQSQKTPQRRASLIGATNNSNRGRARQSFSAPILQQTKTQFDVPLF